MSELAGEAPSPRWFDRVDVRGLGEDARRTILERAKGKLGFTKALEALRISRGALHNYLHGLRRIPDKVIRNALRNSEEKEFNEVIQGLDRLRAVGVVREDGSIDYSLASQVLTLASRGSKIEGLACVLLRLALSDSHLVETALKLIESCDLNHGAAELEKRGW
jgi:hypothetical protein